MGANRVAVLIVEPNPGEKSAMRIADELRGRIARGELRPGDGLPIESDLMVELGVSRFTLREAMRLLEAEGLIAIRRGAGGGPRVIVPSIGPVARAFGVQLQLRDVPLADVLQLRNDLVLDALIETTPTSESIMRLRAAVREMATAATVQDFYRRWIDFTNEVAWLSPNRARSMMVDALQHVTEMHLAESYRRMTTEVTPSYFERAWRSYARVVDLLADGRKDDAVVALDRQLRLLLEGIRLLFGTESAVDVFPLPADEPDATTP
jgi:DNA-binding FadR family transcriptional regulator